MCVVGLRYILQTRRLNNAPSIGAMRLRIGQIAEKSDGAGRAGKLPIGICLGRRKSARIRYERDCALFNPHAEAMRYSDLSGDGYSGVSAVVYISERSVKVRRIARKEPPPQSYEISRCVARRFPRMGRIDRREAHQGIPHPRNRARDDLKKRMGNPGTVSATPLFGGCNFWDGRVLISWKCGALDCQILTLQMPGVRRTKDAKMWIWGRSGEFIRCGRERYKSILDSGGLWNS